MKKERKEVKVWKVLREGRMSAYTFSKELFLRYPVGKFVKPKVGKIFCFKRKKHAIRFCSNWKHRLCYKAIAINPTPNYVACFTSDSISDIKMFWDNDFVPITTAPEGSYVCDELKCLE